MRGDGEGQAELPGDARTVDGGAENPDARVGALARDRPDPGAAGLGTLGCVVVGRARSAQEEGSGSHTRPRSGCVAEVGEDLDDLLGEVARIGGPAAQCGGREPVRARGAPQTQVDPAGVQRGQGADLLGNDERGVVGQHDAAGGNAQAVGGGQDLSHEDDGRRGQVGGGAVVLGKPVALVAGGVGGSSEGDHVVEGVGAGATGADGHHVHEGQNRYGPPFGLTHTGTLTCADRPRSEPLDLRAPRSEGSAGRANDRTYEAGAGAGAVSAAGRVRAAGRWRPGT